MLVAENRISPRNTNWSQEDKKREKINQKYNILPDLLTNSLA